MAADRRFLERGRSSAGKGLGLPAQAGPPNPEGVGLDPPHRWPWFRECEVLDRDLGGLEKLRASAAAGTATPEELAALHHIGAQIQALADRTDRALEDQHVAFESLVAYIDGQVQLIQSNAEEFLARPAGAFADPMTSFIEGYGNMVGIELVEGFGIALRSVIEVMDTVDEKDRVHAERDWRTIERPLVSAAKIWRGVARDTFKGYVVAAAGAVTAFRSGNQLCSALVETLQARYDEWGKLERRLSRQIWAEPVARALQDLEALRQARRPRAPHLDRGTSLYEAGLAPAPTAVAASWDPQRIVATRPDEWPWLHGCEAFDQDLQRLRQLQERIQVGQANDAERAELARLDEVLQARHASVIGQTSAALAEQRYAYTASLQYVDQAIQLIQAVGDERFGSHPRAGLSAAHASGHLLEALGKMFRFVEKRAKAAGPGLRAARVAAVSGPLVVIEGIGVALRGVVEVLQRLDQLDQQRAERRWRAIERSLLAIAKNWGEVAEELADDYQAQAARQLENFSTTPVSLCAIVVGLGAAYGLWAARHTRRLHTLWVDRLLQELADLDRLSLVSP